MMHPKDFMATMQSHPGLALFLIAAAGGIGTAACVAAYLLAQTWGYSVVAALVSWAIRKAAECMCRSDAFSSCMLA